MRALGACGLFFPFRNISCRLPPRPQVKALRRTFSEYGLIRHRVLVEVRLFSNPPMPLPHSHIDARPPARESESLKHTPPAGALAAAFGSHAGRDGGPRAQARLGRSCSVPVMLSACGACHALCLHLPTIYMCVRGPCARGRSQPGRLGVFGQAGCRLFGGGRGRGESVRGRRKWVPHV